MVPQLTQTVALSFRSAEAHPHRRDERKGFHKRLHFVHTRPIHVDRWFPHAALKDWPVHLPTSTIRSRAHTDQQRAHIRGAVCEVFLRGLGQARSRSEDGECATRCPSEARVLSILDAHGSTRVLEGGRRLCCH